MLGWSPGIGMNKGSLQLIHRGRSLLMFRPKGWYPSCRPQTPKYLSESTLRPKFRRPTWFIPILQTGRKPERIYQREKCMLYKAKENTYIYCMSNWKMTTENLPSDILKSFTASSEPRLFSSSSPLRVTIIVHVVRSNKQPITSPLFQRPPNRSFPPCHHCP